MTRRRSRPLGAIALAAVAFSALFAPAESAATDLGLAMYGPRVGLSFGPDQLTLGMFTDWGELADDVHLRTDADIGLFDDVFTFNLNGHVQYHFTSVNWSFIPYAGAGVGWIYANSDDSSSNDIGLNLIGGVEKDLGGYKSGILEVRVGIDDMPDVKITAGLGFQ